MINIPVHERGVDKLTGKPYVFVDKVYFRPTEVELLIGDATKAKEKLGWEPTVKFQELVKEMMDHEIQVMKQCAVVLNW